MAHVLAVHGSLPAGSLQAVVTTALSAQRH
jgi:hypothetical protein